MDLVTFITLISGTCIGGLAGGGIVSRLSQQAIRLSMMVCFLLIIGLLLADQGGWLPMDGHLMALRSWKLYVGFFAMMVCGALTSVGIGLFVLVQGILFLLNVSPLIAFPIMTMSGAMQQPLTTLVFLKKDKIPLKKTLILSLSGCIGVLITLPLVTHLSISWLHSLLLVIVIYNFVVISRNYFKTNRSLDVSYDTPELSHG